MGSSSQELSPTAGAAQGTAALRPASAKHTPGPWQWYGSQHGVYLATTHSGRRYIMGFRRYGMNGAEPTFQVNQRMVPASQLVEFEVGDGIARGFVQGKADPTVYRYDVSAIDAPDARLIAAAPELLAACVWAEAALAPFSKDPAEKSGITLLRAAIRKALSDGSEARTGGEAT